MSQPTYDLSNLFGAALQAMTANRQEINALDGYNGNHGDNMVENLRLITESLQEKSSQTPAEALGYASQRLQSHGRGGTSQYYARGLSQAAEQFQGRSSLDGNDVMSLLQVLLGAIPSQGHQPQPQAGGSVLEQVLGMASGQPPQAMPQDSDLDLDDVLNVLLPAGLAFLQAKQSGADTASAARLALTSALMGGHTNPLQAGTPRAAAGGLMAQSILQALATQR
ncbi:MAG: DAK2 domain-containing protein [Anaerolineae bacterium]|nr:DAK2 domain-containing protein [Anaerolineae bacterium]